MRALAGRLCPGCSPTQPCMLQPAPRLACWERPALIRRVACRAADAPAPAAPVCSRAVGAILCSAVAGRDANHSPASGGVGDERGGGDGSDGDVVGLLSGDNNRDGWLPVKADRCQHSGWQGWSQNAVVRGASMHMWLCTCPAGWQYQQAVAAPAASGVTEPTTYGFSLTGRAGC